MKWKKLILPLLVTVLTIALCGCQKAKENSEPETVADPKTTPEYHYPDQIKERGVLKISSSAQSSVDYLLPDDPDQYGDLAGERRGYVPDFCRRIAEELEVELEIVEYDTVDEQLKALENGDVEMLAKTLNESLTFRSAADVQSAHLQAAAQRMGARGVTLYPVLSAAYTLLKEAGRPNVYLEGEQNFLNYAGTEQNIKTLLEFFADTEAVKQAVSPKTDRTTVLLGEDLEDHPMPGLCIVSKRYVAGGGATGAIGIVGPLRMPYQKIIPRLEYFSLLLGQCMSGVNGASFQEQ